MSGMHWPEQFETATLQRVIDAHGALALERAGRPTIDAWQAMQWRALREWLLQSSAFWRDRLTLHGDWERLEHLPVLARAELQSLVQQQGALPVPRHHGTLREGVTSGSTGLPVRYHASQFAQRLIDHLYYGDHQRQSRNPYLVRAVIDSRTQPHEGTHTRYEGTLEGGVGPLLRRRNNQFTLAEHAAWLAEHAPPYLATNPDWLETLLDEAAANGWPLPRIAQVMAYGSTVSPSLREKARAQLGASVRDRYSCEECGPLAFQCPTSDAHLHVAVANVRIDVVDDAGAPAPEGEPGRVLVTALHQYASPLVRYDLGDIAALHPTCPGCGTAVPTLSRLLGRQRYLLREPNGNYVYVRPIAKDFLPCAPVKEHRLVQVAPHELVAEIVMDRPVTQDERAALIAMLERTVSPAFTYRIQQVDKIAWSATHKRQDVIRLNT